MMEYAPSSTIPFFHYSGYPLGVRAGRMTAVPLLAEGRKVRAPQDRALGNAQSRRREGKCHRKETAPGMFLDMPKGKGERVR